MLLFGAMTMPANAQTLSAAPPASKTQEYIARAGMGDLFEIKSSRLALERARTADVKNFAAIMVKDHTESTKKLSDAAKAEKITVTTPADLDAAHQEKFDKLAAANVTSFDGDYMKLQIAAHDEALSLHRAYAKDGESASIKKVSAEIVKVVEHHREEAMKISAKTK
jgi:putative membrane protein